MLSYDLVIIGAGPAGLSAAVSAYDAGIRSILVIERDDRLGGILNQCIHNGFGLHMFKEELTGPEYAQRFIDQVAKRGIECRQGTMVMDISPDKVVTAMNPADGMFQIQARAVILAMGCRERSRGALNIPGYRPAGIFSAGTAQRLVNMEGQMPGRKVVILGSGDIGLIMARRMTLEGAKVQVVAELMPYSGGLKRNIVQCLNDFDIPLKLSHTVVDIEGRDRVQAVTIAQVDEKARPIPGTRERYECDTLLLSCGLIPENELSKSSGVTLSPVTRGPVVNDALETNVPGVFAAGNVLHVHDLADYASQEAADAGRHAAEYILSLDAGNNDRQAVSDRAGAPASSSASGQKTHPLASETSPSPEMIPVLATDGVRYTVPQFIRPASMADLLTLRFRVGAEFKDRAIALYFNDQKISSRKKRVMAPGEMEEIKLKKSQLADFPDLKSIRLAIE